MRRERQTILVTGGPTRAYLDDVRFLSNLSTGGLAFELCRQLKKRGVDVVAVVGPSDFDFESLKLKSLVRVETNREMHEAVMRAASRYEPTWGIFSAAVLDFEPVNIKAGKVSSELSRWTIQLRPAPKILDDVARRFPKMLRVGFKLESRQRGDGAARKFARAYLAKKRLQGLCYNEVQKIGKTDHRALIFSDQKEWRAKGKTQVAAILIKLVLSGV